MSLPPKNKKQGRKMLEVKKEKQREDIYVQCNSRWKSEDEVTSREMRKVLRRKMTRLSLDHLNQVMSGTCFVRVETIFKR